MSSDLARFSASTQVVGGGIIFALDHPDRVPVHLHGQSPPHNPVIVDSGSI